MLSKRFWSKVRKTRTCWVWTGSKRKGYGRFWLDGADRTAHILSWKDAGFKVRKGYDLDHTCRNKACVRPSHLELVTHAENIRRAYV